MRPSDLESIEIPTAGSYSRCHLFRFDFDCRCTHHYCNMWHRALNCRPSWRFVANLAVWFPFVKLSDFPNWIFRFHFSNYLECYCSQIFVIFKDRWWKYAASRRCALWKWSVTIVERWDRIHVNDSKNWRHICCACKIAITSYRLHS